MTCNEIHDGPEPFTFYDTEGNVWPCFKCHGTGMVPRPAFMDVVILRDNELGMVLGTREPDGKVKWDVPHPDPS